MSFFDPTSFDPVDVSIRQALLDKPATYEEDVSWKCLLIVLISVLSVLFLAGLLIYLNL